MAAEQVMSDRDSEDEVDDNVADIEDQRMLDDFVDVTKDEKRIMHLWNSFVRKQRVLVDSHIPWACEAFSRLHGNGLVRTPTCSCMVLAVVHDQALEPWSARCTEHEQLQCNPCRVSTVRREILIKESKSSFFLTFSKLRTFGFRVRGVVLLTIGPFIIFHLLEITRLVQTQVLNRAERTR